MTTYFPGILSTGALVPGLAASTVRTTLGLGGAALLNVGTTAGTVAAGDAVPDISGPIATHAALTSAVHGISAFGATLIDDAAAVDARNTLGLGTAAVANTGTSAGNVVVLDGSALLPAVDGSQLTNLPAGSVAPLVLSTNLVSQRNSTNAQTLEVFKDYTSATSNEGLRFNCAADISGTPVHRIESFAGSLGGSVRILEFGRTVGTSFVSHMVIRADGDVAIGAVASGGNKLRVDGNVQFNGSLSMSASTAGLTMNRTGNDPFILLQRDSVSKGQIRADANGLKWTSGTGGVTFLQSVESSGNLGVGVASPTARFHLKAGTATANTAPLKLTTGVNLTTPEAGAIEYDGTNMYFTDSGGTRRQIAVV